MGPYREATATEALQAQSREGLVKLEVAPRHVVLDIEHGERLSVAGGYAELYVASRQGRRKKRSLHLQSTRLLVARSVPTQDVGVWHEPEPGVVNRILGIRPQELMDDAALEALRNLDRLAMRLSEGLAAYSGGMRRATEIGPGADRILVMDFGDRIVVHVRRLFREWPRRAIEVHSDGTVVLFHRGGDKRFRCTSRFGITVFGDFLRFANAAGDEVGSIGIPWVTPEDREQLVRLIGQHIDRGS